ncbi:hypothetical protein SBRY_40152 [Actinacidiphila bryophytorum]|uniref:Uncharacterized protein n=1 Tax=Actinacidiphila bryophytorum TaxID=1436133 RepID=A0A9W4H2I3_9ACTN|nr:hypothetical protein SBRY_40152 [Actinacidiphila bryophytorum]
MGLERRRRGERHRLPPPFFAAHAAAGRLHADRCPGLMSGTPAGPETPQRWRHRVRPARTRRRPHLQRPGRPGRRRPVPPGLGNDRRGLSVTTVFANSIGARPTPCCSPPSAALAGEPLNSEPASAPGLACH